MKLTILGSGDAFGSGGRFQTCFLVSATDLNVLIDCGASSLAAMKRFGVDPSSIDAVVISHLHGDHFGGLVFLLRETQVMAKRSRALTIIGPPSTEQRLREAMQALFPGPFGPLAFDLNFLAYSDAPTILMSDRLQVSALPVPHTAGTEPHAVRVRVDERVVAYSGDGAWSDALPRVAEKADAFLCEAYTFHNAKRNHLSYETLMRHRDELTCRRLITTHMSDSVLERLSTLETPAAHDGLMVELG